MSYPIPGEPSDRQIEALLKPFEMKLSDLRRCSLHITLRLFRNRQILPAVWRPLIPIVTLTPELIVFDYNNFHIVARLGDYPCLPDCPELRGKKLSRDTKIAITEIYRDRHGSWSAHFICDDDEQSAGDFRKSLAVTVVPPTST
ncbi:MAG TPA: hypothetical protein VGE35_01245 [Candidatus Paceibacterota bacterium]